ncbi:MAG: glycosyltransferase family 87 protein [Desulfobaccales bacterium]|nr:glycosyltransferase family 87 protein [Desulfobaccales bacterium]
MNWPTSKRLALYCQVLVATYIFLWCFWTLTGAGLTDRTGLPVGGDFAHYWAAASLALNGQAAAVYDYPRLLTWEQAFFGPELALPFLYPPTFLLMLLPLAFLPYLAALAVWLLPALAGYLLIVRRLAPHPLSIWLTLAFFGTFQNFIHGQNGFLSAVLLGGGLCLLERSPWTAGLLLGLLSYKPHLAALIPVALVAGRRWQALLAMSSSALGLALASILMLGLEVWLAFLRNLAFSVHLLKTGEVALYQMPTSFSTVLLAGGGLLTALTLQGLVMLTVTAVVAWVWAKGGPVALRSSVLTLSILLFTPYLYDYDLALLTLPLAWLGWEGYTKGWLPQEKILLILGWCMPMFAQCLAKAAGWQLGPLILAALLLMAVRRESSLAGKARGPWQLWGSAP